MTENVSFPSRLTTLSKANRDCLIIKGSPCFLSVYITSLYDLYSHCIILSADKAKCLNNIR
ncbi:MAG: hypothetical protein IJ736_00535, partial [Firmicutes bacterium]|nr:hypothetical protein [Bacillota bacterium]